jgi:hypothetical protein
MDAKKQFYVAFTFLDLRYLAIVTAPRRPARLEFATYEEFHEAMDSLGELWSMRGETPDPIQYGIDDVAVWQKQLAHVKELVIQPQADTKPPWARF